MNNTYEIAKVISGEKYLLAWQAFPWADINKSLTVAGLLEHRHTRIGRKAWGQVMQGSDDDLLPLARACVPPDAEKGIPPQAREAFARMLLWNIEEAIGGKSTASWNDFSSGWKHAKGISHE